METTVQNRFNNNYSIPSVSGIGLEYLDDLRVIIFLSDLKRSLWSPLSSSLSLSSRFVSLKTFVLNEGA